MINVVAIVLTAIGTYVTRAVFIVALADRTLPDRVERALQFVGPAVLSALVITLMVDETGRVVAGVPEVAALVVGCLVAWRTRSVLAVVAAGMTVFWTAGIWF